MSIGVFGFSENPLKDRASFRVTKSTAHKWIVLGTHVPIDLKNIQAIDPSKKREIRHSVAYTSYIPAGLPPPELPGIKFIDPAARLLAGTPQLQRIQQVESGL
jgi:hypothetical protein